MEPHLVELQQALGLSRAVRVCSTTINTVVAGVVAVGVGVAAVVVVVVVVVVVAVVRVVGVVVVLIAAAAVVVGGGGGVGARVVAVAMDSRKSYRGIAENWQQ